MARKNNPIIIGQPVLIYEMDDRHGERFIGTIE